MLIFPRPYVVVLVHDIFFLAYETPFDATVMGIGDASYQLPEGM